MLAAGFENWIRTLRERDFDDTFLTLLRASGFVDVHFTHGNYEFGKDFIAKLPGTPGTQYAFQSKAGDIGGAEWDRMFAQLDQLTSTQLVHPNFSPDLPHTFVLVTTGQLTGKAILCAKDFRDRLRTESRGTFLVWDSHRLREVLSGAGPAGLPPSPSLGPILGRISSGTLEESELPGLLAELVPPPNAPPQTFYRALLDCDIVTSVLTRSELPFHSLTSALNAVRVATTRLFADPSVAAVVEATLSRYVAIGKRSYAELLASPEDTRVWMNWGRCVTSKIVTYPATCLRLLEFLGIATLHDKQNRSIWLSTLCRVAEKQPGTSRPISDRYAACVAPAVIALALHGMPDVASRLLVNTTKWLCDRYERSEFGLAGPYASSKEEVETLLGASFESVPLHPRRESLLAVALADLAYCFASEHYGLIINDILAVGLVPSVIDPSDSPDGLRVGSGAATHLLNIAYPDSIDGGLLPHHRDRARRTPEAFGLAVALPALGCLLRDRLFSDCYPRFIAPALD